MTICQTHEFACALAESRFLELSAAFLSDEHQRGKQGWIEMALRAAQQQHPRADKKAATLPLAQSCNGLVSLSNNRCRRLAGGESI
jgi:hypothetical protein